MLGAIEGGKLADAKERHSAKKPVPQRFFRVQIPAQGYRELGVPIKKKRGSHQFLSETHVYLITTRAVGVKKFLQDLSYD